MNIKVAAKETQKRVLDAPCWPNGEHLYNNGLGRLHVAGLLEKIINETVSGEKANRWLGWAQAALVATGNATLDEMKNINHKA